MKNGKKSDNKIKPCSEKHINTDRIEGKIEIPDTRERRDGPGGD